MALAPLPPPPIKLIFPALTVQPVPEEIETVMIASLEHCVALTSTSGADVYPEPPLVSMTCVTTPFASVENHPEAPLPPPPIKFSGPFELGW